MTRAPTRWLPQNARTVASLVFAAVAIGLLTAKVRVLVIDIQLGRSDFQPLRFLGRLAFATYMDIATALGLAFIAGVSVHLSGGIPRARGAVLICTAAVAAFLVAFSMGNVELWRAMQTFLTYDVFLQAGGFTHMETTVHDLIPWAVMLAAAALVVLVPPLAQRLFGNSVAAIAMALGRPSVVVAAVIGLGTLHFTNPHPEYMQRWSPHFLFASTWYRSATGLGPAIDVAPEYFEDFRRPGTNWAPRAVVPTLPARKPASVIVVVIESGGATYLPMDGGRADPTPRLSELARSGLVFPGVYAGATHSEESLVGLTRSLLPRNDRKLVSAETPRLRLPDIARVFREHGRRTVIFGPVITSRGHTEYVRALGFDDFVDPAALGWTDNWLTWRDAGLVDGLLSWIDRQAEKPYFALVWTSQTHYPYPSSGPVRRLAPTNEALDRYLSAMSEADAAIGRLRDGLAARHLDGSTMIAVTGDHGESFGQHGLWARGHLYEPSVRGPFVVHVPGLPEGRRVEGLGEHIDVAPTILDLAGLPVPEGWQGNSLVRGSRLRAYMLSHLHHDYLVGLREGQFKYIIRGNFAKEELYDLAADPGELHDIAADRVHAELITVFRQRLVAWHRFQPELYRRLDLEMGAE